MGSTSGLADCLFLRPEARSPETYTNPNIFLYHNVEHYIEGCILPLEPQCLANKRRLDYYRDVYLILESPEIPGPRGRDLPEAANKDCERI